MRLTIGEMIRACGGKAVLKNQEDYDRSVTCVVLDSRMIEAGGVFIASVGERVDGHKFISKVFSQGAALALTQKTPEQVEAETGEDCSTWGSYVLVEDSLEALRRIAEYYRENLDIRVVGITGSVGKTSTKEFIAAVLAQKYKVLKAEGNQNNEIGVPLTLLRIREEHEIAVVEMGISDFGEMHVLSRMAKPDICVITNIGQSHLNNLKSRDGILKAKSEIFDFMAQDGEICLNGEDDKLAGIREIKGHKPHFFGLGNNPEEEVSAVNIVGRGLRGSEAELRMGGHLAIHVPLPGAHMVLNAAAAACVGRLLGLTPEQIAAGIGMVEAVSGRNHLIWLERYTLIDDCYNANPASMKAAIDLLELADTEKVAILGDMFNLGEDTAKLHSEVGEWAASAGIDYILCVGELAEHTYKAAMAHAAEDMHIFYFPTRDMLMNCLKRERRAYIPDGSTVLLKASHGMEFVKVLEYLQEEGA